jgi:hypothetical protein
LVERGLLTYEVQNRKYAITERGIQFLNLFIQTSELLTIGFEYKTANDSDKNIKNKSSWHYMNNASNDKRIFTSGCTVEWRLDTLKFTDFLRRSEESSLNGKIR